MTDEALAERNAAKLQQTYHVLRAKFRAILTDLQGHGWRVRIQEAWRSEAAQLAAFEAGYSKVRWGFHNATGVGGKCEALACDFVLDDRPYDEPPEFFKHLRSSAKAHELSAPFTGARGGFRDPWHVQVVGITIAQARRGVRPRGA